MGGKVSIKKQVSSSPGAGVNTGTTIDELISPHRFVTFMGVTIEALGDCTWFKAKFYEKTGYTTENNYHLIGSVASVASGTSFAQDNTITWPCTLDKPSDNQSENYGVHARITYGGGTNSSVQSFNLKLLGLGVS